MNEPSNTTPVNTAEKPEGNAVVKSGFPGLVMRWVLRLGLASLLLLTVYVTAGRLLMPGLSGQKDMVAQLLSEALGAPVSISAIRGDWYHFSPVIVVDNLQINIPGEQQHKAGHVAFELDFWQSLALRRLVVKSVVAEELKLTFEQTEEGRWRLFGVPSRNADYTKQIFDFALGTARVSLTESSIEIRQFNGPVTLLDSIYLQLQNQDQSHDFKLQLRVDEQNIPSQSVINLRGDPRLGDWQLDGWLQVNDLQLTPYIEPFMPETWQLENSQLSTRLWVRADQAGIQQLDGFVDALHVTANNESNKVALGNAELAFSLFPLKTTDVTSDAWQLNVRNVELDWQSRPWSLSDVSVRIPASRSEHLVATSSGVDAAMLSDIALAFPLPAAASQAIQTLALRGKLENITLETALDRSYPDIFLLKTNFSELAVDAWSGAPAGNNLSGFVEAGASRGTVEVDAENASIYMPRLFTSAWHYDAINARVNWQVAPGLIRVNSSPIHVFNDLLKGQVQFDLFNQRQADESYQSELSLLVGMEYMDVALHSAYLPTLATIKQTMDWLDAALVNGRVINSGFALRTPTDANTAPASSTHLAWFQVDTGTLKFLEQWPALDAIQAGVLVRDDRVDVLASSATMNAIPVSLGEASLRPDVAGGSWLQVKAGAQTNTAEGLNLLRTTPIRDSVGSNLDTWSAAGSLDIALELGVPLGSNPRKLEVLTVVDSHDSTLDIDEYKLLFEKVNGRLRYTESEGLSAENLQAELFAEPVVAQISTQINAGESRMLINASGGASIKDLTAWGGQAAFVRSLLDFTAGELSYDASFELTFGSESEKAPILKLSSPMVGVSSAFPPPFTKTADSVNPFLLDIVFLPGAEQLSLRYNNMLSGQLVLSEAGIKSGQLHFGMLNQNFTIRQSDSSAEGLLITGDIDRFNYEAWESVAVQLSEKDESSTAQLQDYLRLIDVTIADLSVSNQNLEDIGVQISRAGPAWSIYAQNTLLAGKLLLADEEGIPWEVDLEWLRFPAIEQSEPGPSKDSLANSQEVDLLADTMPQNLPAANFHTKELSVGEDNLGEISFQLQPQSDGVRINDFRMQETASVIGGIDADTGATLLWSFQDGQHSSRFDGVLTAKNLADVMPKWGHDANVISKNARFSGNLEWPGSPLALTLPKVTGHIDMAINDGRFVDINSGSSRLLGAFNFDSLVRRLQLDFSDLYERGFTFDSIRGELEFVNGVVNTPNPVVIDGPSSRLSIKGEINLVEETIAADMQVRIPLGQNISMLAGILGAWPIAVSTYLASKIFADQVEDFTTVIYRLEGPWENLQAEFEAPKESSQLPASATPAGTP